MTISHNDNLLRLCPVLDNPGRLTELVNRSNTKGTDYQNTESIKEFYGKCVSAAEKWADVPFQLWAQISCDRCAKCVVNAN